MVWIRVIVSVRVSVSTSCISARPKTTIQCCWKWHRLLQKASSIYKRETELIAEIASLLIPSSALVLYILEAHIVPGVHLLTVN